MSQQLARAPDPPGADGHARSEDPAGDDRTVRSPDDLLDLLGDDYARAAIDAIREEPMSGAEVAEATGMSKPTAFRRLNELADVGLVAVRRRVDPERGYHSKLYELVADSLSVDFADEELQVSVTTNRSPADGGSTADPGVDSLQPVPVTPND